MGNERWNERLAKLRAWMVEKARPHPVHVQPKCRRSGPRLVPSDWWMMDRQAEVLPQCLICHERVLPGSPPLTRGLCGPCKQRLDGAPDAA